MPKIRNMVSSIASRTSKKIRPFAIIWERRISFVVNQLISMRILYGKPHEGEAGLILARFIKETFRTISSVRKLTRLANSDISRAFMVHTILNTIDEKYRRILLSKLLTLRDKYGEEFVDGVHEILKETLSEKEYNKVSKILGTRIAYALVSKNAVFDPLSNKLYTVDPIEGQPIVKDIDLRSREGIEELLFRGLLDKRKDLLSDFAEWRIMKIVEEAESKGPKGTALGAYVHHRILEEIQKDPDFLTVMKYYLVKHFDTLEKSRNAMIAFGDLLVEWMRLQKKIIALAARAAASIPVFGQIAGIAADMGEAVASIGEGIRETVRKRSENRYPAVKIELPK